VQQKKLEESAKIKGQMTRIGLRLSSRHKTTLLEGVLESLNLENIEKILHSKLLVIINSFWVLLHPWKSGHIQEKGYSNVASLLYFLFIKQIN
jgi:hypothetical protein